MGTGAGTAEERGNLNAPPPQLDSGGGGPQVQSFQGMASDNHETGTPPADEFTTFLGAHNGVADCQHVAGARLCGCHSLGGTSDIPLKRCEGVARFLVAAAAVVIIY